MSVSSLPPPKRVDIHAHFYPADYLSSAGPALPVESVGADRLVLGTDHPQAMGDLAGTVKAIEGLAIAAEEREAILGRAGDLLGLSA